MPATKALLTYGDMAVVVQLYPPPTDLRREDLPSGKVPWRPAWVAGWYLSKPPEIREVIEKGEFALVLREQDGETCLVNPLSGNRILHETARQQDTTAVELPCAEIWEKLGSLGLAEGAQSEVAKYLRTSRAPPLFASERRRRRR